MSRDPRYVPPGWSVEITNRTTNGFFLLPVTRHFARIFAGVLALAQEKCPGLKIHAAVAVSGHYHLILTPVDSDQLADFMEFFDGNLAREAGRLVGWRGPLWVDRFHHVLISPEPEAMIDRLRYLLSHTIKENLVAKISDWEGFHCAQALIDAKPMSGIWYDRSGEYEAKRQAARRAARRGTQEEEVDRGAFMVPYQLKFAPLPCWEGLPAATIRKKVAQMVAQIEEAGARWREETGKEPLGMDRIRNQDPLSRPLKSKHSPKPLCHAASAEMRERVKIAYREFKTMFREASLKLKFGDVLGAVFPKGSFPPGLPYVRTGEVFDPLADAGGSPGTAIWADAAA